MVNKVPPFTAPSHVQAPALPPVAAVQAPAAPHAVSAVAKPIAPPVARVQAPPAKSRLDEVLRAQMVQAQVSSGWSDTSQIPLQLARIDPRALEQCSPLLRAAVACAIDPDKHGNALLALLTTTEPIMDMALVAPHHIVDRRALYAAALPQDWRAAAGVACDRETWFNSGFSQRQKALILLGGCDRVTISGDGATENFFANKKFAESQHSDGVVECFCLDLAKDLQDSPEHYQSVRGGQWETILQSSPRLGRLALLYALPTAVKRALRYEPRDEVERYMQHCTGDHPTQRLTYIADGGAHWLHDTDFRSLAESLQLPGREQCDPKQAVILGKPFAEYNEETLAYLRTLPPAQRDCVLRMSAHASGVFERGWEDVLALAQSEDGLAAIPRSRDDWFYGDTLMAQINAAPDDVAQNNQRVRRVLSQYLQLAHLSPGYSPVGAAEAIRRAVHAVPGREQPRQVGMRLGAQWQHTTRGESVAVPAAQADLRQVDWTASARLPDPHQLVVRPPKPAGQVQPRFVMIYGSFAFIEGLLVAATLCEQGQSARRPVFVGNLDGGRRYTGLEHLLITGLYRSSRTLDSLEQQIRHVMAAGDLRPGMELCTVGIVGDMLPDAIHRIARSCAQRQITWRPIVLPIEQEFSCDVQVGGMSIDIGKKHLQVASARFNAEYFTALRAVGGICVDHRRVPHAALPRVVLQAVRSNQSANCTIEHFWDWGNGTMAFAADTSAPAEFLQRMRVAHGSADAWAPLIDEALHHGYAAPWTYATALLAQREFDSTAELAAAIASAERQAPPQKTPRAPNPVPAATCLPKPLATFAAAQASGVMSPAGHVKPVWFTLNESLQGRQAYFRHQIGVVLAGHELAQHADFSLEHLAEPVVHHVRGQCVSAHDPDGLASLHASGGVVTVHGQDIAIPLAAPTLAHPVLDCPVRALGFHYGDHRDVLTGGITLVQVQSAAPALAAEWADVVRQVQSMPLREAIATIHLSIARHPQLQYRSYHNDALATTLRDVALNQQAPLAEHLGLIVAAGGGKCVEYSLLTLALLRLAGIPAVQVQGVLAKGDVVRHSPHAWVEVPLPAPDKQAPGRWLGVVVDTTNAKQWSCSASAVAATVAATREPRSAPQLPRRSWLQRGLEHVRGVTQLLSRVRAAEPRGVVPIGLEKTWYYGDTQTRQQVLASVDALELILEQPQNIFAYAVRHQKNGFATFVQRHQHVQHPESTYWKNIEHRIAAVHTQAVHVYGGKFVDSGQRWWRQQLRILLDIHE